MNVRSLSSLRKGECGVLCGMEQTGGFRRRLRDLGMLPGTEITCANIAPSGSPMAFWVRGTLIALRTEDCGQLQVNIHG